jgi:hypothetical protein
VLGAGVLAYFGYTQGWFGSALNSLIFAPVKLTGATPPPFAPSGPAPTTAAPAGMQWSWNGYAWVATGTGNI